MTQPKIDKEFKSLCPPLSQEEFQQLTENIKRDGCREPLVTWNGILLDGHNRLEICTKHNIKYKTFSMKFNGREEAANWIDTNQLGRRNLTPDAMTLLLGRIYERTKKAKGGTGANQYTKQIDQDDPSATANKLAEEHGVSAPTVKRAGKLARDVETLKETVPDIEQRVMAGELTKKSVTEAAKAPERAEEILKEPRNTRGISAKKNGKEKPKKKEKRTNIIVRLGLDYASRALSWVNDIPDDDEELQEAMEKIIKRCNERLEE